MFSVFHLFDFILLSFPNYFLVFFATPTAAANFNDINVYLAIDNTVGQNNK